MASEPLRRSERTVASIPHMVCELCTGYLFPFNPQAASNLDFDQGRCPECFRFRDEEYIQDNFGNSMLLDSCCFCLCGCVDTDDADDADFEMSSDDEEPEDEYTTILDPRTEAIFASRAGFIHDAMLNEDTDDERRVMAESAGHFATAAAHDLDVPAESSVANAENRIGITEVLELTRVLEPWEAINMVQGDPTRTWADYQRFFPEMAYMGYTEPHPEPEEPQLNPCRFCLRPINPEWRERFRRGNLHFCGVCVLPVRPANPESHRFDPNLPGAIDYCRCYCFCPTNTGSQRQYRVTVRPRPTEDDPRPDNLNPFTEGQIPPAIPSVAPLWIALNTSERGTTYDAFADAIREEFELPNARLSDNRNQESAMLQNVQWALEDGLAAIQAEEYPRALRYLQLGLQIGRYILYLDHNHRLMASLLEASNVVDQNIITGIDNAIYTFSIGSMTSEESTYSAPVNNNRIGVENMPPINATTGIRVTYDNDVELPDYESDATESTLEEGEIREENRMRYTRNRG